MHTEAAKGLRPFSYWTLVAKDEAELLIEQHPLCGAEKRHYVEIRDHHMTAILRKMYPAYFE